MSKKQKPEDRRTLYVKFQHEKNAKKVTIPANCKVTFGPLCPGSKHDNGQGATALRIYNGPTTNATQIACFVKVETFYEIDSVSCVEKVTKRATKVQEFQEDGVSKKRNVSVEISEWRDELAEEESGDAAQTFAALKESHDDKPF